MILAPSVSKPRSFYDPDFFFAKNLQDAKVVIVNPLGEFTADKRWDLETKWIIERIKFDNDECLVVDYGCGAGRLAKEIKNPILGVDSSQSMRVHAEAYVGKDSFSAITPEMLQILIDNGLRVSGVISVWVLQHVFEVEEAINMLMKALLSGGTFWLLDINERCIPCFYDDKPRPTYEEKFIRNTPAYNDKKEIYPMIDKWCDLENAELLPLYTSETKTKLELRKYRRR